LLNKTKIGKDLLQDK